MPDTFNLLLPEWQGGPSDSVQEGAHWLSLELMPNGPDAEVPATAEEQTPTLECVRSLELIARSFRTALSALTDHRRDRLLAIGGTCAVEAAPISYLNHTYQGNLGLVYLDAHADLNTLQNFPKR